MCHMGLVHGKGFFILPQWPTGPKNIYYIYYILIIPRPEGDTAGTVPTLRGGSRCWYGAAGSIEEGYPSQAGQGRAGV